MNRGDYKKTCASVFCLICVTIFAQSESKTEIDELIQRLGSDRIDERDAAAKALRRIGKPVLAALELLINGKDLELGTRARDLITEIESESVLQILAKIESRLIEAGTVSVKFDCKGKVPDKGQRLFSRVTGKLFLKRENLVSFVCSSTGEDKGTILVISDGAKLRIFFHPESVGPRQTAPETLRKDLIAILVRLGLGPNSFDLWKRAEEQNRGPFDIDIKKSYLFSGLSEGNDGDLKKISYRLRNKNGQLDTSVVLWYRPETGQLVKRTMTQKRENEESEVYSELYTEFLLGQEIPADEFKVTGKD